MFQPSHTALPTASDPVRAADLRHEWASSTEGLSSEDAAFIARTASDPQLIAVLDAIFGNSPFLARLAMAHTDILRVFVTGGPNAALGVVMNGLRALDRASDTPVDIAVLMRELRVAKARAALAIALADITAQWTVNRVVSALSAFADACVHRAVTTLLRAAAERGKITLKDLHNPAIDCGYVVLAVGKLGANELNYSSDIDLFVLFDAERLPYIGKKSHQEFAVELTKDLVRVMQERTSDGYVFRTDLRLRPDPGSTSIAVSRDAAQSYYESYGQNWERAALIKARFLAGDRVAAEGFLRDLQPFIWRKSLDFYALQDIHSIKRQIYAHKGGSVIQVGGHNIKLGRGGIREIEFFVQTQQLIWGGRLPETRLPQTLAALDALCRLGFVTKTVRDDLTAAYLFLRKLEHRLQMVADEQTQSLPSDTTKLTHLATFMGYRDLGTFETDVTAALRAVEQHYAGLFEDAPTLAVGGNLVFTGTEDDPDTMETLRKFGFTNPSAVGTAVRAWHHGRYRATRSNRARQLLTEIIPSLLIALGKTAQPDAALVRFDRCLAELQSGVQLLSVFQANPQLLDLVAEIMGDAPRLAEHLARNPALLDYVLEPEFFAPISNVTALTRDLVETLETADAFEITLDLCRRWANDERFRVGVQTLRSQVTADAAARAFSDIAEAVVNGLVPRVAAEFAQQYGSIAAGALAILAYGKLGSRDLTSTSDLDVVVVYDAPPDGISEGGPRSLPVASYYMRLTQRLVTALSVLTRDGVLYNVDLRLRPDGDQGPLACSFEAFAKYHQEQAWTWEHMALSRARVVYGPATLAGQIGEVMAQALTRARDPAALVTDVADMRSRIRKEHPGQDPWDLKHRAGGLIDGEFMIQYQILRAALGPGDTTQAGALKRLLRTNAITARDGQILERGLLLWTRLQVMLRLTLGADSVKDLPLGLQGKLAAVAGVGTFADLQSEMDATSSAISNLFRDMIEKPAAHRPSDPAATP